VPQSSLFPPPRDAARTGRRWLFGLASLLAILMVTVLLLEFVGSSVQSGVRAYVGGEGLWSKAQKDAVLHLGEYMLTADEKEIVRGALEGAGIIDPLRAEIIEQVLVKVNGDIITKTELETMKSTWAEATAAATAGKAMEATDKARVVQAKAELVDKNFGEAAKQLAEGVDALESAIKSAKPSEQTQILRGFVGALQEMRLELSMGKPVPIRKLTDLQQNLDRELNK